MPNLHPAALGTYLLGAALCVAMIAGF